MNFENHEILQAYISHEYKHDQRFGFDIWMSNLKLKKNELVAFCGTKTCGIQKVMFLLEMKWCFLSCHATFD